MGPVLRFVAHIAKDEHRSHEPRNSSHGGRLPWWVLLLVVYASVFFLLFFSSLTYYWKRENERKKDGQPFRTGKVLWKAFTVGTGLWTWIWVFRKHGWCGPSRKKDCAAEEDYAAEVGTCEKNEARKIALVVEMSALAPSTTGAPTASSWYGIPANISTTHAPYAQPNDMTKSPFHISTYQGFAQYDSIQMSVPSSSPGPSPNPGPGPGHAPYRGIRVAHHLLRYMDKRVFPLGYSGCAY
ncbi:hypothetical protein CIB48_g2186 [Xylaria polymorpha]|nr:hypothetical protein CIB48_g2186 [Xylaria polymorpha]